MSILVLIRHGQSVWNAQNLFTGWRDPALTEIGIAEAQVAGKTLAARKIHFDAVFTSELIRAQHTCALVLAVLENPLTPICNHALNERDYGALAGLNKDDARKKWGEKQVHIWRRSYDIPPPEGESLKDTAARVLLYYETKILPLLCDKKNVLIVAHGNSLRALVMKIEAISTQKITELNIDTGVPYLYNLEGGTMRGREIIRHI